MQHAADGLDKGCLQDAPVALALPWYMPDGSVNTAALRRMVEELLLLGHLFPGISTVGLQA